MFLFTIGIGMITALFLKTIGKRWIKRYFKRENYYRIDGKPVISIYDINNLINGLGGIAENIDALQWLNFVQIYKYIINCTDTILTLNKQNNIL